MTRIYSSSLLQTGPMPVYPLASSLCFEISRITFFFVCHYAFSVLLSIHLCLLRYTILLYCRFPFLSSFPVTLYKIFSSRSLAKPICYRNAFCFHCVPFIGLVVACSKVHIHSDSSATSAIRNLLLLLIVHNLLCMSYTGCRVTPQ